MVDKFHKHEALDRCHLIASMIDDHLMFHPYVEQDATVKKLVLLASEAIGQAYQVIGGSSDILAETQEQRESARVLWLAACEALGRANALEASENELLDILAVFFEEYEYGPDCYEDPDDCAGHLGKAVHLSDEMFHRVADILTARRPRQATPNAEIRGGEAVPLD